MYVSELFLTILVYAALFVTSATPFLLLYLFFKDFIKKSLW